VRLISFTPGGGVVSDEPDLLRLSFAGATERHYTDAEAHDYATGRAFAWRPPLRLQVRARASHSAGDTDEALRGTAGFGFWNVPFMIGQRGVRLPEAIWFFYASPPSRMDLVPGMPGWGWKAQVVHAQRWGAVAAIPPTLASVAWARLSGRQRTASRWVQRLSGAHETAITADLAAWHAYRLEWEPEIARFFVDDAEILRVPHPPRGPLGFVAWIDNQYMIATPRGEFRAGLLATGPQWLELADLRIITH
jgi:hypothetical protein